MRMPAVGITCYPSHGGSGRNTIEAGDGNNTVTAGNAGDTIIAGNGDNTITGGSGDDAIFVGNGNNAIAGAAGDDYISAGDGDNAIAGGAGDADLYFSGSGWASPSSYQLRSAGNSNSETLQIPIAQPGYYYLTVHAYQAFSGLSLSTRY